MLLQRGSMWMCFQVSPISSCCCVQKDASHCLYLVQQAIVLLAAVECNSFVVPRMLSQFVSFYVPRFLALLFFPTFFFSILIFEHKVLVCSLGWAWLCNLPDSASPKLGLQACATLLGFSHLVFILLELVPVIWLLFPAFQIFLNCRMVYLGA